MEPGEQQPTGVPTSVPTGVPTRLTEEATMQYVSAVEAWLERRTQGHQMLEERINCTTGQMQSQDKRLRLFGYNKFFFLIVIAGCEMDLYGYFFTSVDHWRACQAQPNTQWIIRIFVVLGLVAYFGASFLYLSGIVDSDATDHGAREVKITLKPYHFLPILRFFLIIKDQEENDVEALFGVNALSSFTLGLSVCVSLMLQHSCNAPWSFFTTVNVATQILNGFITLMYYATGIVDEMRLSTKVDAQMYNIDLELKHGFNEWIDLVLQASEGHPEDIAKLNESNRALASAVQTEFSLQMQDGTDFNFAEFPRPDLTKMLRFAKHRRVLADAAPFENEEL